MLQALDWSEELRNPTSSPQDLSMENHAPKDLQPIKDFQLALGTRIFIKIDYPRLCCQWAFLRTWSWAKDGCTCHFPLILGWKENVLNDFWCHRPHQNQPQTLLCSQILSSVSAVCLKFNLTSQAITHEPETLLKAEETAITRRRDSPQHQGSLARRRHYRCWCYYVACCLHPTRCHTAL